MSNCTSGCRTQDHASYAECLRSNVPNTRNSSQSRDSMYFKESMNAREITEYKKAYEQGIRPAGSKLTDINQAVAASREADRALTLRN